MHDVSVRHTDNTHSSDSMYGMCQRSVTIVTDALTHVPSAAEARYAKHDLLIFHSLLVAYVYPHFQNVQMCLKVFVKHQAEHERDDPPLHIKKVARPLCSNFVSMGWNWAGN